MKISIYLFLFVIFCFQACDENETPDMEPFNEIKGTWKLIDFDGNITEYSSVVDVTYKTYHNTSFIDTFEYTINIGPDEYSINGQYRLHSITTYSSGNTSTGSIGGATPINPIDTRYTINDDTLIYQNNELFGMKFPIPNADFGITRYDTQTSQYIIEDDKLIITKTEVGNAEPQYVSQEKIEFEFKSTWERQ